jgi:hypothetical protein
MLAIEDKRDEKSSVNKAVNKESPADAGGQHEVDDENSQ